MTVATTQREAYVAALMDLLATDADLVGLGVIVERSIYDAIDAQEPRVLVVHRGRDTVTDTNIGRTTRECVVLVSAVVRDAAPDRAADTLFALAHPLVMRFDASNVVGITEIGATEPEFLDLEGGVGAVSMQYQIQYQTAPGSL